MSEEARPYGHQRVHELKTWASPFRDMLTGAKRADFRRDDRNYRVGDTLILREYDPRSERYSGRRIDRRVVHVQSLDSFGAPGYVLLSLEPTS